MDQYHVLGVMSGSSLDGLDVCFSQFQHENERWSFEILETETLEIPQDLSKALSQADRLGTLDLLKLDVRYGEWIGQSLKAWLEKKDLTIEIIGLHGHTVFHEPKDKISLQIGNGQAIAKATGVTVIDNFRSEDVLKGGQGAPLVPAGEHYLFPDYQAFVNLGGIANIAIHKETITAWDIAPCNQVLNFFAEKMGKSYDDKGKLALSGAFDQRWFDQLGGIPYFNLKPPKSLSNQWTQTILNTHYPDLKSGLHTYSKFLASLLSVLFKEYLKADDRVLLTGGGTFNDFLIEEIKKENKGFVRLEIPSPTLISFKEAIIFGFLGLLKMLNKVNVFKSVTGAQDDSMAGTIHHP